MNEQEFRQIVHDDLVPMLQGTLSDQRIWSTRQEHLASYESPTRLVVKPARTANYRVAIDRSQKFTPSERRLAGQFIDELAAVVRLGAGTYQSDLLKAIPRRVVAEQVGGGELLRSVLERLEEWSSQTYEGQRIVAAIGITTTDATSNVTLAGLWEQPFGPVLTNGFDTLVVVGRNGDIDSFVQLSTENVSSTAPYRLREIACWAAEHRISVVLNRHGEILVFEDRSLRFARRSGVWLHYIHEANIMRLSPPQSSALREALYESCLDVSFSRTGGCIGVLAYAHRDGLATLISPADSLARRNSYKTKLVARAIHGARFQDLDRRARLELLSMDGATILDHLGNFLSVGAIIQVPAGSVGGGGRTAAARKLSTVGLGLKISADGTITGFRDGTKVLQA